MLSQMRQEARLDKSKVLERGDDAVVVEAVGDVVGLFLEEVRRVAHGDANIDRLHEGDVVACVADAVHSAVIWPQGVKHGLDSGPFGALARRDLQKAVGGV